MAMNSETCRTYTFCRSETKIKLHPRNIKMVIKHVNSIKLFKTYNLNNIATQRAKNDSHIFSTRGYQKQCLFTIEYANLESKLMMD